MVKKTELQNFERADASVCDKITQHKGTTHEPNKWIGRSTVHTL